MVAFSSTAFDNELGGYKKLYDIDREYITLQYSLINNRTTWYVTFQGFLFAAFGGITASLVTLAGHLGDKSAPSFMPIVLGVVILFDLLICATAVGLSQIFSRLIRAASNPVHQMFNAWQLKRKAIALESDDTQSDPLKLIKDQFKEKEVSSIIEMPNSQDKYDIFPLLTGGFEHLHAIDGIKITLYLPTFFTAIWVGLSVTTLIGSALCYSELQHEVSPSQSAATSSSQSTRSSGLPRSDDRADNRTSVPSDRAPASRQRG